MLAWSEPHQRQTVNRNVETENIGYSCYLVDYWNPVMFVKINLWFTWNLLFGIAKWSLQLEAVQIYYYTSRGGGVTVQYSPN